MPVRASTKDRERVERVVARCVTVPRRAALIHDVNPSHLADLHTWLREALLDARARPSSASRYKPFWKD